MAQTGTITLTQNSTAVTGSGTAFTTALVAGGFIVATVGGTAYTLGIKSIESNTALTLNQAYNGPTTSGLAFDYVPMATLNLITSALAAQVAYALRAANLDRNNWQQIFSGTGNVTVALPDGTSWTGPAWGNALSKTSNLSDLSSVGSARNNLGLGTANTPSFGGFELTSTTPYIDFHWNNTTTDFNVRLVNDADGILSFGGSGFSVNSARFYLDAARAVSLRYAMSGSVRYAIIEGAVTYSPGGYRTAQGTVGAAGSNSFNFFWTGSQLQAYVDASSVGYVSLNNTSDKKLKKDIKYREDVKEGLSQVLQWRAADFKMKARGIIPETTEQLGFIANDIVTVSPECVSGKGLPENYDIVADPNNSDAYYLNAIPMIAKLTQAIQAQQQLIEEQGAVIKALGVRLKDIDGLDG